VRVWLCVGLRVGVHACVCGRVTVSGTVCACQLSAQNLRVFRDVRGCLVCAALDVARPRLRVAPLYQGPIDAVVLRCR
jgi:hypothetical protein